MTVEEKRQILYAALLNYSPEIGSLRERVLDRLVLVALLESSPSQPMKTGKIQASTRVDPNSPGLRPDVIQGTLARLVSRKQVERVDVSNKKHLYYLSPTGLTETDRAAETAAELFRPVLERMVQGTSGVCDQVTARIVCRTFISECFARFGQQIAKTITGELSKDQLISVADIQGAFRSAISSVSLATDAAESLEVRCRQFLRSTDPQDEQLKFRLTQGYYVTQILGAQPI